MTIPRQTIAIPLFMVLLFGAGCGAFMYSLQSSFFSKFSLRELVDRNKSIAGLDCASGGGGGSGISVGTGGFGKQGSNSSKLESLGCQISDAEIFDEAKFIQALELSIEQDLNAEKATIVSKTVDANSLNIEYSLNDVAGIVKISAKTGPMRFYTLEADLKEKSK